MKPQTLLCVVVGAIGLFLVACSSTKVAVDATERPLWLPEPCERRAALERVKFPAGEYRAVLKDAEGVYYAAPGDILGTFNEVLSDNRVYVTQSGRHGIWYAGGPVKWLSEPLPFSSPK